MYTGQFEELKKAKEDITEECARERSAHKGYKKDYNALRAEYSNIRLKVEINIISNSLKIYFVISNVIFLWASGEEA